MTIPHGIIIVQGEIMRENDTVELKMTVNGESRVSIKAKLIEFDRHPLLDEFMGDVYRQLSDSMDEKATEIAEKLMDVMRGLDGLSEEEFFEVVNAAHQRLHQEKALGNVSNDQESGPMADSAGRRARALPRTNAGGSWQTAPGTQRPRE